MITWWQAILISLASAGATGVSALLLQARQLHHDTRSKLIEARRAQRREILQPLVALLAELDKVTAKQMSVKAFDESRPQSIAAIAALTPPIPNPEEHYEKVIRKYLDDMPAVHQSELLVGLGAVLPRIRSAELRGDILAIIVAMAQSDWHVEELSPKIAVLHDHLEKHLVDIPNGTDDVGLWPNIKARCRRLFGHEVPKTAGRESDGK